MSDALYVLENLDDVLRRVGDGRGIMSGQDIRPVETPGSRDYTDAGSVGGRRVAGFITDINRLFEPGVVTLQDAPDGPSLAEEAGVAIDIREVTVEMVLFERPLDIAAVITADDHQGVAFGMQFFDHLPH